MTPLRLSINAVNECLAKIEESVGAFGKTINRRRRLCWVLKDNSHALEMIDRLEEVETHMTRILIMIQCNMCEVQGLICITK